MNERYITIIITPTSLFRHIEVYPYFTSIYNAEVKHKIVSEICSAPNCTYSDDEVKGMYVIRFFNYLFHQCCVSLLA